VELKMRVKKILLTYPIFLLNFLWDSYDKESNFPTSRAYNSSFKDGGNTKTTGILKAEIEN